MPVDCNTLGVVLDMVKHVDFDGITGSSLHGWPWEFALCGLDAELHILYKAGAKLTIYEIHQLLNPVRRSHLTCDIPRHPYSRWLAEGVIFWMKCKRAMLLWCSRS